MALVIRKTPCDGCDHETECRTRSGRFHCHAGVDDASVSLEEVSVIGGDLDNPYGKTIAPRLQPVRPR